MPFDTSISVTTQRSSRQRGVILSTQGLQKFEAMRQHWELKKNGGDRYTLHTLSILTGLSQKTITKVLEADKAVDRATLQCLFNTFDLVLEREDYRFPIASMATTTAVNPTIDWHEVPDTTEFYGRTVELSLLTQWMVTDRCRLVGVVGMGGMGKSSLVAKAVQELAENLAIHEPDHPTFTHILWRSLRHAVPIEDFLRDVVLFLSDQQDTNIGNLIYYLQRHRCLLILDNWETLFQPGDYTGHYRSGYSGYGELLKMLGESKHQSCVIFTSRERPLEVAAMSGDGVRSLSLQGMGQDAQKLLQARGLLEVEANWQKLSDRYAGNPLMLKIVTTTIQEMFGGNVADFLQQETQMLYGIRKLLDQQFDRLSALEQSILYWLAINRVWTTPAMLQSDLIPKVTASDLLAALESLRWRCLIEMAPAGSVRSTTMPASNETPGAAEWRYDLAGFLTEPQGFQKAFHRQVQQRQTPQSTLITPSTSCYTQEPVVMEYVTDRFVAKMIQAILHYDLTPARHIGATSLLHAYTLVKTNVEDDIQNSQIRFILQPIADRIQSTFSSYSALEQHIQAILKTLPIHHPIDRHFPQPSYAAGNLLNLCLQLKVDLK